MVDQIQTPIITATQVAQREAEEDFAREIVAGQWVEERELPGQPHGLLVKRVTMQMDRFVAQKKLGEVYPDGVTYVLEGTPENITTQRVPDVSFVKEARVNRSNPGAMYFAPDLAVEILSPTEWPGHTAGKIADYLRFGTQQVWVIDPQNQTLSVHFPDGRVKVYESGESVPGGELLPDFALNVAEIFVS
jgi:Uma2 family endonuclease